MDQNPHAATASSRGLLAVVIRLLMMVAVIPTQADPDLWGNLRFGLDILGGHAVSSHDIYSFTQDVPWINHEWLAQLAMAATYRLGGTAGLVLLKTALVSTSLWLVGGTFAGAAPLVAEAAAGLVLWGALPITLTLRAQLWTFLGLAILCRILLAPRVRSRLWIPPLFAVWANCHIGWTLGLGVLFLWIGGELLRNGGSKKRLHALALVGFSAAATLVNPYGWGLWRFSFEVAHMSRQIQEWQALWTSPVVNWIPWILSLALVAVFARQRPRLTIERLVCLGGFAYAAARALKFSPLFVEMTMLLLSPAIQQRFVSNRSSPARSPLGARLLNAAAVALVATFVAGAAFPSLSCLRATEWHPDATAASALKDANPSGRMAVWFDWGEYSIWQYGPRLRVSFDPRYDLLYSPETIRVQQGVANADAMGTGFLEREKPDYVWYPQTTVALKRWLGGHGYRIDVDTDASYIGVRADLPPLHPPEPRAFGCFPAP